MIPANIKLPNKLLLEPTFALFLEPLALSNPNWEFLPVTHGYEDTRLSAYFGDRADAPANNKFLCHVKVKLGDQTLGHLRMNRKVTAEGNIPNYAVKSWRIVKSRGDRNETETTKANIAIRNAKKYFKPRTTNELFEKRVNELKNSFTDATNSLTQGFRYIGADFAGDVQLYAYCFMTNRDVPHKLKESVEKVMSSTTYEKSVGDYQLALDLRELEKNDQLVPIIKTRDDKYMYAQKGTSEPIVADYEQLPQAWQDKIAVLQLLQDSELARDIGYRYSRHSFVIIK